MKDDLRDRIKLQKRKESAVSYQKRAVTVIKLQPCKADLNINAVKYNLNALSLTHI